MTGAVLPRRSIGRVKPLSATVVVSGYAASIALLLITHQAAPLRLLIPASSFLLALWLYWHEGFGPYVAFAWGCWMVMPGLRRVVDFQLGAWDPENPISLTPFLVSAIAALSVMRRLPELRRRRLVPWIVVVLAVCYGYFAGMLEMGAMAATHALLSWLVPLLFGLAIALEWRQYPDTASRTSTLFFWGGLVLAIYALVQFVSPPAWDRLWVQSAGMHSVGVALPFQLRVFSLVNAPLALATLLAAAAFLTVARSGPLRIVVLLVMVVALLLTLVRSVWVAGAFAAAVYLVRMPRRAVTRAAFAALCALALLALVPIVLPTDISAPIVETVSKRFATFGDLHDDISVSQRKSFVDQVSSVVMDRPLGHGLGSTGVSSQLAEADTGIHDFDSGILAALYALGWVAGGALLLTTVYMTLAGFTYREGPGDMIAAAARSIMLTGVVLSAGGNVFEGVSAAVLWGFAGLLAAAQQWHHVNDVPRLRRVR